MNDNTPTSTSMPSTTVQKNSENPNGQAHTMAGASGGTHTPPNAELTATRNISIDPCSKMGCK